EQLDEHVGHARMIPPRARAPRQTSPGSISRILRRRRCLVRRDLAPCGGRRRATKFLLLARPRVGRRSRKILAKILELWRHDAVTRYEPESRKHERRCDAVTGSGASRSSGIRRRRRAFAISLAARARVDARTTRFSWRNTSRMS